MLSSALIIAFFVYVFEKHVSFARILHANGMLENNALCRTGLFNCVAVACGLLEFVEGIAVVSFDIDFKMTAREHPLPYTCSLTT